MSALKQATAYLLMSGGQDSFVSLYWAREHFSRVEAVVLNYGQRHQKELDYAKDNAEKARLDYKVVDIRGLFQSISRSALLDKESDVSLQHSDAGSLPASFVPGRNGLFLSVAATYAFSREKSDIHLVTGVCQTDFSGYPDCRDNYIKAKQLELSLGLERQIIIHTPLMFRSKAETFAMAESYGVFNELIHDTLTCYEGCEDLHDFGRGCSDCPSCKIRKKAYFDYLQSR